MDYNVLICSQPMLPNCVIDLTDSTNGETVAENGRPLSLGAYSFSLQYTYPFSAGFTHSCFNRPYNRRLVKWQGEISAVLLLGHVPREILR